MKYKNNMAELYLLVASCKSDVAVLKKNPLYMKGMEKFINKKGDPEEWVPCDGKGEDGEMCGMPGSLGSWHMTYTTEGGKRKQHKCGAFGGEAGRALLKAANAKSAKKSYDKKKALK